MPDLDEVNMTQATLDALTEYVTENLFKYLGFGTGSTPIALDTADVASPVSIASGVRNLFLESVTVNGNFFKIHFVLTAAMPETQPQNLRQVIIHDGEDDTTGAFYGHTFAVSFTKDADARWDIWLSGKLVEIERT